MKYRSEIDGLRALAVVPVVFFHAGIESFGGGFVGVDVFFVISGFLITTILLNEIESQNFSILNFYERRARRILPALVFVIISCLPFAWLWMLPSQLVDFSQSLIAVAFFTSNFLFWQETGYFAASAEEKPLLHTWSLAVEEQYYILFPVIIHLLWRFGKAPLFWFVFLLSCLSFCLSEFGLKSDSSANFYLAPSRAWELLAGSMAAFVVNKHGVQKSQALSLIGLGMIVVAIFAFDKNTPFPGKYTLLPVLGTVLIIVFSTPDSATSKILGWRPFVAIGLISYSTYLWHQPIFAFVKIFNNGFASQKVFIFGALLSFVLAYISWKFVEAPFRQKHKVSSRNVWIFVAIGVSLFSAIGSAGVYFSGFPSRVHVLETGKERDKLLAIAKEWKFSGYPEHPEMRRAQDGFRAFGNGDTSVVLLGDSHAQQYWNAFGHAVENKTSSIQNKTIYVKSIPLVKLQGNLKLPPNTKKVVLSYFWALHFKNTNVDNYIRCCGDGPGGVVGKDLEPLLPEMQNRQESNLKKAIQTLQARGITVVLVLDNPFGKEINPKSLVDIERSTKLWVKSNELSFADLTTKAALARSEPTRAMIINLATETASQIIDPFVQLCPTDICNKFGSGGKFLYKDYDHLSMSAIKGEFNYIFEAFE